MQGGGEGSEGGGKVARSAAFDDDGNASANRISCYDLSVGC